MPGVRVGTQRDDGEARALARELNESRRGSRATIRARVRILRHADAAGCGSGGARGERYFAFDTLGAAGVTCPGETQGRYPRRAGRTARRSLRAQLADAAVVFVFPSYAAGARPSGACPALRRRLPARHHTRGLDRLVQSAGGARAPPTLSNHLLAHAGGLFLGHVRPSAPSPSGRAPRREGTCPRVDILDDLRSFGPPDPRATLGQLRPRLPEPARVREARHMRCLGGATASTRPPRPLRYFTMKQLDVDRSPERRRPRRRHRPGAAPLRCSGKRCSS